MKNYILTWAKPKIDYLFPPTDMAKAMMAASKEDIQKGFELTLLKALNDKYAKTDLEKVKELFDYLKIEYTQFEDSGLHELIHEDEHINEVFTFELNGKFKNRRFI